jgi:hypothetical protein
MYGFNSYKTFIDYYNDSDVYISDVIKRALLNNLKVKIGNVFDENNTIVLGTPSEYENNSISLL